VIGLGRYANYNGVHIIMGYFYIFGILDRTVKKCRTVLTRLALLHYDDTMIFLFKGEHTTRFDATKLRDIPYDSNDNVIRTYR
jgi:hypothetical protein